MEDRILVFIPMYNCEKQIVRVMEQLKGEVSHYISEVIIIDNQSTDNGENAVLNKMGKMNTSFNIRLMRNQHNYGLGGSHKVAFNYAIKENFDYIIVLHGDDQGNINDLLPVLKDKSYKKYDCCLGGRFYKGSRLIGYSKFRTWGNRVFNIIFSISVSRKIYDLGAGLNMYSVSMLQSKYYQKFPDNLTFNCYMLFALSAYNQSYKFIPITWREEDQISNVKITKQAWQTLKMAAGFFFQRLKFMEKDARSTKYSEYNSDEISNIQGIH